MLVAARRLEAAGRDVIHLEIGEPDFPTPEHIVEAAARALREGKTKYTQPAGIPELRTAIAEHMAQRGVTARPERVVVTPGAKPILFYSMLTLVRRGDEVLVPDPGFPIYESVVRFAEATPRFYSLRADRGFAPDLESIASLIGPRTRAIMLNSPHNPTGGVARARELEAVADLAQRHDLVVLADEIYSRHVHDVSHASIAALEGMADRTVIVDGFSKTFAMTGWRLGYGVMPEPIAERVTKLIVNSTSCTAAFVQHAGVAALTGPQGPVATMVAEFRERRDLLVRGLSALDGVSCTLPSGAFYAFPDFSAVLSRTGLTTETLAHRLLHEHGVACLAGTAFGERGRGHVRFSYAASRAQLTEALNRLRGAVAALPTVS